jgi:hypothetical protein
MHLDRTMSCNGYQSIHDHSAQQARPSANSLMTACQSISEEGLPLLRLSQ